MADMEDVDRERKTCKNTGTNIHLAHCTKASQNSKQTIIVIVLIL